MESLIFILAGFVTGIITGIIGASSIVAFIPIILLFLDYNAFSLIGASLALDVFVALVVFLMYRKYHHIKFKIGIFLSIFAVIGAVIGSYVSISLPQSELFAITGLITIFTGVGLFRRKRKFKPVTKLEFNFSLKSLKFWLAILLSFGVGLIGGGLGAAGGISLLLLLILLFRFEIHEAIGTSVFIMFFIALAGSLTHFYLINFPITLLIFAIAGGISGAIISARFANLFKEEKLNKLAGLILIILGLVTFLRELIP
ncbi:MAG: sulfite exporter TauE/SafE family protein [Nanoarchaeota archaeon]|nr:sulfite exporter TauE/SafE family protein [Nanoarchaeota archaeon]